MEILRNLHDHEFMNQMIRTGGYALLFAIIFAETGLLVGFFLPGDSLLFLAGLATTRPEMGLSLPLLMILLCIAAVTGDATGYLIGRKVGPGLYARPNSRLFKREHLQKTQDFYDKHGPKTIVLARFVPIVRTFAPTVAGVAGMNYKTFAIYNVCGGIGWVVSMLLLGSFLGKLEIVERNLSKATLLIVFLSILPMIIHFIQEKRHKSTSAAAIETIAPGVEIEENLR